MLTRVGCTVVNYFVARFSCVTRFTMTCEAAASASAVSIQTRIRRAVVNFTFTVRARETNLALASVTKGILQVDTLATVLTGTGVAIVDGIFTVDTGVASGACTVVPSDFMLALAAILAWVRIAVIYNFVAVWPGVSWIAGARVARSVLVVLTLAVHAGVGGAKVNTVFTVKAIMRSWTLASVTSHVGNAGSAICTRV